MPVLPVILTILATITIIALWAVSVQRRLVTLDENVNNAMNQIGVQLSSCFDVLTVLLDFVVSYHGHQFEMLIKTVKSGRNAITAKSTPDDVLRQEGIISEAMSRIASLTEQCPELKNNNIYIKAMNSVQIYENMVRNSHLIYNNSVSRLNRETRKFPVSMLARMLGFRQREYFD